MQPQGATYILKAKNKPLQMLVEQLLIQKIEDSSWRKKRARCFVSSRD